MIQAQLIQFFTALYGGLVIGVIYLLCSLPRLISGRRWIVNLLDGLFYAAAGVVAGLTLFLANGGVPRFFLLAGMGLGVALFLHYPYKLVMGGK